MHRNRLGRTNYGLLSNIFCLPSTTTAETHSSRALICQGIDKQQVEFVRGTFGDTPICISSDEGRLLRYLEPLEADGRIELVGHCWDPDPLKWCDQKVLLPRKDETQGDKDDFTALKRLVTRLVENDCLAKGAYVMNAVGLIHGKEGFRPSTLLGMFSFPNKGFRALHQLLLWETVHNKLTRDDKGEWRRDAVACIGAATDSAGFQLAAAIANMSPTAYQISKGVVYLSLGVPGERFVAPFRGKFPFISYLDYPHNRRLFLKCLKYTTLQMTMYSEGKQCYWITVNHLKELHERCKDEGVELSITATDLLLIRFMDQNIDACDKVFTTKVAELLRKYVPNANATTLYIKAVYLLTEPFRNLNYGGGCPQQIQKSISAGITILRLWKKYLELKKKRLHAAPGAKTDKKRAGSFITYGCFMTAEIHFAAATLHMLAMCACFPHLGVGWCSPHYANTLPTEHSIGEMQGKTNQFQSVNQQPTFGEMLHKARVVEFNQDTLQRLAASGIQIPASSSHKRKQRRHQEMVASKFQNYPPYDMFKQMQQKAYQEGVQYAQSVIEECLPSDFKKTLQDADAWDCPYRFSLPENISLFQGYLPAGYEEVNISVRDDPAISKQAEKVAQAIASEEQEEMEATEERVGIADEDGIENEEETIKEDKEVEEEEKEGNTEGREAQSSNVTKLDKWYITRMVNGSETRVHVRQALKLILPREYVSRERAKRHIVSKYLKGFQPIAQGHDLIQFRFVAVKTSQKHKEYEVVKIQAIRKIVGGKFTDVVSASSKDKAVELRGIPYHFHASGNLSKSDSVELTGWIKANCVLTEVLLDEVAANSLALKEESRQYLQQFKAESKGNGKDTKNDPLQVEGEDPYYQVEDVIDVKIDKNTGATMYLARFKGYGPDDDQWLFASAFKEGFKFTSMSSSGRKIKRRIRNDEIPEDNVPRKRMKKGTTTQPKMEENYRDTLPRNVTAEVSIGKETNEKFHWILVILWHTFSEVTGGKDENKRPCIIVMDSMNRTDPKQPLKLTSKREMTVSLIKRFILQAWEYKEGKLLEASSFRVVYPLVPQQPNSVDCGLYVIKYAEEFLKKPFTEVKQSMDLRRWFHHKEIVEKRMELLEIFTQLYEEYASTNCQ